MMTVASACRVKVFRTGWRSSHPVAVSVAQTKSPVRMVSMGCGPSRAATSVPATKQNSVGVYATNLEGSILLLPESKPYITNSTSTICRARSSNISGRFFTISNAARLKWYPASHEPFGGSENQAGAIGKSNAYGELTSRRTIGSLADGESFPDLSLDFVCSIPFKYLPHYGRFNLQFGISKQAENVLQIFGTLVFGTMLYRVQFEGNHMFRRGQQCVDSKT
jgi:hypothetical protein